MRITWLADVLRAAGLEVVEHAGWETRERPGVWEPKFLVVHATAAPAGQADETQVRIVRDGRSDLNGPIANACIDRQGRWHVLAAGRCNTTLAGTAGPFKGLGNTGALGIEACNDNRGGPWPDVQYRSYVAGVAAICRRLGWSETRVVGHREHTPGHKTDPTFGMQAFRAQVREAIEEDDMPSTEQLIRDVRNTREFLSDTQVMIIAAEVVSRLTPTLTKLLAVAAKDPVDEQALAAELAPGVASLVVAALPDGAVTPEQLQAAIVGALRELAAPAA